MPTLATNLEYSIEVLAIVGPAFSNSLWSSTLHRSADADHRRNPGRTPHALHVEDLV